MNIYPLNSKLQPSGGKFGAKLSTMYRTRRILTTRAKRKFYLSFIQFTLEYASNAYVHCLRTTEYYSNKNCFKAAF